MCHSFFRGITKNTFGDPKGYKGRISKYWRDEKVPTQFKKSSTIRQLRYLSTTIYFHLQQKGFVGEKDIKEVQILKIEAVGKLRSYYIATNHKELLRGQGRGEKVPGANESKTVHYQ